MATTKNVVLSTVSIIIARALNYISRAFAYMLLEGTPLFSSLFTDCSEKRFSYKKMKDRRWAHVLYNSNCVFLEPQFLPLKRCRLCINYTRNSFFSCWYLTPNTHPYVALWLWSGSSASLSKRGNITTLWQQWNVVCEFRRMQLVQFQVVGLRLRRFLSLVFVWVSEAFAKAFLLLQVAMASINLKRIRILLKGSVYEKRLNTPFAILFNCSISNI